MSDTRPLEGAPTAAALTLGSLLEDHGKAHIPAIGVEDIHVIRHAYIPGGHEQIQAPEDLNDPNKILAYTREQSFSARRFISGPPRYWVIMIADGGHCSRLFGTYENLGQLPVQQGDRYRIFDLRPSDFLASLAGRLVVEWDAPRAGQRRATKVASLPVLEFRE
ncbi:hypothetical protein [Sinomonas sp. G460-2]|uniref:hypothetical protein n=1 Tax=Sinomonas sp. G460-2 TaxID=3393464 RepID=UPI0039F053A7